MTLLQKQTNKQILNSPQIPDPQYRVLIIGGSGSEKAHTLLNLIQQ